MQSGRVPCPKWLWNVWAKDRLVSPLSELSSYLCPAHTSRTFRRRKTYAFILDLRLVQKTTVRRLHTETSVLSNIEPSQPISSSTRTLPAQCHGCGALAQTSQPNQAGFYNLERLAIRKYLKLAEEGLYVDPEDEIVKERLRSLDLDKLQLAGVNLKSLIPEITPKSVDIIRAPEKPPLCERCHNLIHHNFGASIFHPSIESLRETIEESPHKYNHVYHVVDAADFPMSLLPKIHHLLDLMPLRSQNRRSKSGKFMYGKKTEMSFIITRSDLLAPKKEQVDTLMAYLRETLRDALGRDGRDVRLGNLRCVSAKRNWWTKEVREDIWRRGGAGWMVGKVNVGKSQLFRDVFPKGRTDWTPPKNENSVDVSRRRPDGCIRLIEQSEMDQRPHVASPSLYGLPELDDPDHFSLLPPAQVETQYPAMPVVSDLPGTTASPIRVPFGSGRGELIDLPGLSRGDLELHVKKEYRSSLLMKSRIVPEQQVIKPGRSLLIGGFIRITPRTPDQTIFLMYNFTPLQEHVTATEKAILVQTQAEGAPKVDNISKPGTGTKVKLAGTFKLKYDVTKPRAGPITRKEAAGISVDKLPYRVLSIDVLIEGCGWVEIVAQVRTRRLFEKPRGREISKPHDVEISQALDMFGLASEEGQKVEDKDDIDEPRWPEIDVFTPEGRFIQFRRPMNAWLLNKPMVSRIKSRPRPSMKGVRKEAKAAAL